jgi:hypothetical protein
MFQNIAFYQILGEPLLVWLRIATLLSFLFIALIAVINLKGRNWILFKWHPRMAIFSICLAIIHGTLVILALF